FGLKDQARELRHFGWQGGYADFGVSVSNLERMKKIYSGAGAPSSEDQLSRRTAAPFEKTSGAMGRKISWE
ncbi:MAG TPA: hypothetical protein VGR78_02260, partial [Verrucomicrobiae bacterium]|nr:hypothetical protein [Verrucomicrobiae bacterium]